MRSDPVRWCAQFQVYPADESKDDISVSYAGMQHWIKYCTVRCRIWPILSTNRQLDSPTTAILCTKQTFSCTIEPIEVNLLYNLYVTKRSQMEFFCRNIYLNSFLLNFETKTWTTTQDDKLFLTFKHEAPSSFGYVLLPLFFSCHLWTSVLSKNQRKNVSVGLGVKQQRRCP